MQNDEPSSDPNDEPPPSANARLRMSRVKVACCLCSAAKVRCDQHRPCSRCRARGTSDLCVDRAVAPNSTRAAASKQLKEIKACNPCYLAKVGCSDTRPCPRCVRLQQPESCIIISRRNSSQQQRQRPAAHQHHQHPPGSATTTQSSSSMAALISVLATPAIVPASLRNLLMNAVYIRYTAAEIARFVRDTSRMNTLLDSLATTLSTNDQAVLRNSLLSISASKECTVPNEFVPAASSPSPFSVVNNCFPIDLLSIDPAETSDAILRFQIDVNDPATLWGSIQMSPAAAILLGYSVDELKAAIMSNPAPESHSSVMFINAYWKLFHPSSWEVIACNYLDCVIRELSSAQFPARLMLSDARTVDVLSSWQMGVTTSGAHTITVLFTPLISDTA